MVLHALSFGALLILGVTYCSIQNKQQVTGRLMKELRGQSGEYYPISKNRDEKDIRSHPNCSNSNNNNKADTDLDGGYSHVAGAKILKMSPTLPPEPPPLGHRNVIHFNPDERQLSSSKNVTYSERSGTENEAGYEQLQSKSDNIEKSHNYEQLKQKIADCRMETKCS